MITLRTVCWLAAASLLTGCGSVKYTVDDGRHVNETMLANIRTLGMGEQAIRPAIVRAAALKPATCETQWELPFSATSSDGLDTNNRIAWLRALNVDERLTVIASTPESTLALGDKIVEIDGYRSNSGEQMNRVLAERRDDGRPFNILTAEGRSVRVAPLQVCRGHVTLALPSQPAAQNYHWTYSTHPLEVFREGLTQDEALWVVLWTQGLSEEGGTRMKAYQYGLVPLRFLVTVAAVVSGVGAITKASQSAGAVALKGHEFHKVAAASQSVGTAVANEIGFQIAKNIAANQVSSIAQQQAVNMMAASSKNRASLEGVAWAAGTVFEKADAWSFERMLKLGADPLAAITLHQKLVNAGSAANAFVLDDQRLSLLQSTAKSAQLDTRMAGILSVQKPGTEVPAPELVTPQLTSGTIPKPEIDSAALPADALADTPSNTLEDQQALARQTTIPLPAAR